MNNPSSKQLEDLVARFEATPYEKTCASQQDAFELLTLQQKEALRVELMQLLPSLDQATFADVSTMVVVLGFGALREGARAYACAVGPFDAVAHKVSFERLAAAADETALQGSSLHAALVAEIGSHQELQQLTTLAGQALLAKLLERFPLLCSCSEDVERMVFTNLVHGLRSEYLLRFLVEEDLQERSLLARALDAAERTKLLSDDELGLLRGRFRLHKGAEPWPKDLRCPCGADLRDSLECCGAPIRNVSAIENEPLSTFILKTDCCGASLTGVRCKKCSRYFTWTRGTVTSPVREPGFVRKQVE